MSRSVYALVVGLSLIASACVMVEDDDIEVVELDSFEEQSDTGETEIVWHAVTTGADGQTLLFVGQTPNGEPIDPETVEVTIDGGEDLGTSVELGTVEQFVAAEGGSVSVIIIGKGIGTSP